MRTKRGYDKEEMIAKAVKAIEKNKLVYHDEVWSAIGVSEAWYYKNGIQKVQPIKQALEKQKINVKQKLRKRWLGSKNPTSEIALYKLMGTEDEVHRLNGSNMKIDTTVREIRVKLPTPPDE